MPDFLKLKDRNLKYLDALTYATIRSFHNSTDDLCYPPYEKIMELSGLSRGFISASIKRLESSGMMTIEHSKRKGTCNRYHFSKLYKYERIPYEIFQTTDLTVYEKAMLLCLKQFANHGSSRMWCYTVTDLARMLGLTYKQVYTPFKGLIARGYLNEQTIITTRGSSYNVFFTSKIDWAYDFGLSPKIGIKAFSLKVA